MMNEELFEKQANEQMKDIEKKYWECLRKSSKPNSFYCLPRPMDVIAEEDYYEEGEFEGDTTMSSDDVEVYFYFNSEGSKIEMTMEYILKYWPEEGPEYYSLGDNSMSLDVSQLIGHIYFVDSVLNDFGPSLNKNTYDVLTTNNCMKHKDGDVFKIEF